MKKYGRTDGNQTPLIKELRKIPGLKVLILSSVGDGCPDFCVGWMGENYLFEAKNPAMPPSKRRLTADEKKFHNTWTGQVAVVLTLRDVLDALKIEGKQDGEIPF